jgi:outer membrane immunogenic protein
MRKILVAVVCLGTPLFGAQVNAADAWMRRYTGPYNWSGFYVGIHVGYGWATTDAAATIGGTTLTNSERLDGFLGGIQAGHNWQVGQFVFGLEADISASGQEDRFTSTSGAVTISQTDRIPWLGTVRARAGFALDQWLVYATAGGAFTEIKTSGTSTTGGVSSIYSGSAPQAAWTVGAGIETALWASNWTTRIEYLYVDTFDVSKTSLGLSTSSNARNNIVRWGLNYRF